MSRSNFRGNVALVTGASRGIGKALALGLASEGAQVLAVARHTDSLKGQARDNVTPIACDIADPAQRAALVRTVRELGRPIDFLINNAGIQQSLDLEDRNTAATGDAIEKEMTINLLAPMLLTTELLPSLRQPGGTIVNVTSLLALHPKTSAPAYSASKAGLRSFTHALRRQTAPIGLHVVEVIPPLVDTDMTAGRGRWKLSAEDMARAILQGIAEGKKQIAPRMAGLVLALNGMSPRLVARILGSQ